MIGSHEESLRKAPLLFIIHPAHFRRDRSKAGKLLSLAKLQEAQERIPNEGDTQTRNYLKKPGGRDAQSNQTTHSNNPRRNRSAAAGGIAQSATSFGAKSNCIAI